MSGRVNKPGVHLAPAGITLNELVNEYCGGLPEGHTLYGYLPGGASGGILPARLADVPLDFDTLQPHGCFIGSAAVMVLTQSANHVDRATDAARNMMRFFEDESCGQCTPCRSGTAKVRELIASDRWNTGLLAELSQVMRDASICGPGPGRAQPGGLRHQVLPAGTASMNRDTIEFQLNGQPAQAVAGPKPSCRLPSAPALPCRTCASRKAWSLPATAAPAWWKWPVNALWRPVAAARRAPA